MTDYKAELIVNDYNDTQFLMEFRSFKFFWPKSFPTDLLVNYFLREAFDENDCHYYMSIYKPKPTDVFYDLGSSEGIITKRCIDMGVKKAYAFDPLQCFIDSLNLLFENDNRVESFCIGFADRKYIDNYAGTNISIDTLDNFMEDHPDILPPTVIKMDLEGYDLAALKGAYKTISTYHPDLLLCTYHTPHDKDDFIELLTPLGYKTKSETDNLILFSVN